MSISLAYAFKLTTTETLSDASLSSSANQVIHNAYDESGTLTASTGVPVTAESNFLLTLSGGAATIDLRNLTGTGGGAVDGNGLKLQFMRIKNLGANDMVFTTGASNGYAPFGPDGKMTAFANGGLVMVGNNDKAGDVGSSAKTIDVTGTGSQTAEVTIIMG